LSIFIATLPACAALRAAAFASFVILNAPRTTWTPVRRQRFLLPKAFFTFQGQV